MVSSGLIEPQESRRFDEHEHHRVHDISPILRALPGLGAGAAFGIGAGFCVGVGLIAAAVDAGERYGRELRNREAWEILGGCLLPGVGRAILHRLLWDRPDLDKVYPPRDASEWGGQNALQPTIGNTWRTR